MKSFEKSTKDEIITTIVEHMNEDITCSSDDCIELHFENINDKTLRDMYCFFYNYEGHKIVELQVTYHSFGCFDSRKKILLIDSDKNYINNISSSYDHCFDEFFKMTKNNVEKALNMNIVTTF